MEIEDMLKELVQEKLREMDEEIARLEEERKRSNEEKKRLLDKWIKEIEDNIRQRSLLNNTAENPSLESQIVCFHNPDEPNGFLSNWAESRFTADDQTFSSLEQFMMYEKAILFNDCPTALQIMKTNDPREIKALGRQVSGYDDSLWNDSRKVVVYEGLMEKFSQNPDLLQKLLNTDNAILAECAVHDRIWGIGLSMKDPDRFHPDKWKGQNLLGFLLMIVRTMLKDE